MWFNIKATSNGASISLMGEIGGLGHTAQDFNDQLTALGNPKELHISISSPGGDVSAGFAIYNMLNRHSARKIVTVEGLAASMASVIAMAGDEVVMPSNAMMMIHNPLGSITGGSDEIESFASALKIMRDNIAQAYKDRTGLGLDEIQKMMTRETWLSAEEAVAKGFADRIEAPRKIAASNLGLSRFTNVPDRLLDSLHSEGSHSTLAGITDRAYQKWNSAKPRSEEARDSAPDERASDSTLQSFQEDIYAKWNSRKRDAL